MRKGDTRSCETEGCPVLLRWNGTGWVHAIRNRTYDHTPTGAPTTGLTGAAALDALSALTGLDHRTPTPTLRSIR